MKLHNKGTNMPYFGALDQDYTNPYAAGELKIKKSFYIKYVKRTIDIIVSLLAIILTLPINLIIAVLTLFDLGQPVFFVHERPGLGEIPFRIIKFRNMTMDTDENGDLLPPDERITSLGKLLRKTSLDELLQFGLIFTGKMSLIGPRPLLMKYLPRYNKRQHMRHAVRPGLECPMPDYAGDEVSWEERLENDVWYVENISFRTDCIMLFRLVRLVFNRKRAKIRGERIDGEFMGTLEVK
ncbi:MAG: sugar transferase [Eubacteriales bacterium]|nr:sugar transferase [Eubacteriales bacterium]